MVFGSVADRYERYRPDYPDELVDVVLHYAGGPLRRALEVGAGTGKATRLFARRGMAVTAQEPDADMARVLDRATHGATVTSAITTFEAFRTEERFDLVYAAAAWHWTDPVTRWARAAELLRPGGVLALFGRPAEISDPDLSAAVAGIEKQVLTEDAPSTGYGWSMDDMARVPGFADATRRDLPDVVTTTAADFVGRLGTVSAYLMLSPQARAAALRRVHAVLPDRFELDVTTELFLARRVESL
jgi:SAM-dependent methyltransferase